MIYKPLTAAVFSLALAASAFAQTGTGTAVDPGATKPTGTSQGAMPDSKPADDTNTTMPDATTGGAIGTDKSGAMGTDAPKANSSDADKGGLNCPDTKTGTTAMSNDSTKPPTKPEDCPAK